MNSAYSRRRIVTGIAFILILLLRRNIGVGACISAPSRCSVKSSAVEIYFRIFCYCKSACTTVAAFAVIEHFDTVNPVSSVSCLAAIAAFTADCRYSSAGYSKLCYINSRIAVIAVFTVRRFFAAVSCAVIAVLSLFTYKCNYSVTVFTFRIYRDLRAVVLYTAIDGYPGIIFHNDIDLA